jgi:hypothetical protein
MRQRPSGQRSIVSDGPDLSHFVQHRQLDVYEQSMARQGYAYGVDLRRSHWLASSTVGNALVRAVDRAWSALSDHLMAEVVVDARTAPLRLLRELGSTMNLLRAPVPTVKLLRPEQRGRWPLVTPLGATRGGALWLILDVDALAAVQSDQRAFLLGAGLGHLHCDHAVFFSAHLLANRREGNMQIRALRSAMTPWTKVMVFSADRAGLIACGRIETAVAMIENPPIPVGAGVTTDPSWLPPVPPPAERIRALEEFARSAVFARVIAMRARQRELARNATLASNSEADPAANIHVPADAWTLARVDARLTARLNLI